MAYVKQIAAKWLDWNTVGPLAQKYQTLIAADVKADTRKLASYEAFEQGLTQLKSFMEQRKAYLGELQVRRRHRAPQRGARPSAGGVPRLNKVGQLSLMAWGPTPTPLAASLCGAGVCEG